MGLLTARTSKKFNFKNPRWQTAAVLKTVISPYLCNLLADFHEIWYSNAYWSPMPDVKFNFVIYDNLMWRRTAIWRIEKLLKYIYLLLHNNILHNFDNKTANINTKHCSLSVVLTATDQKPQKSLKR